MHDKITNRQQTESNALQCRDIHTQIHRYGFIETYIYKYTDKALQRHTNTNIQIYDKLSYFTNSHRGLNFKHR